jgi:hypothetical protein
MNRGLWLLLIVSMVLVGCRTNIGRTVTKDLIIDEITFDYLSARTRVKYDDGIKDISGTANVRMAYDSIIWVSITPGLGIEAARLLITQDSVFFIDRINKKYMKLGYEDMSKVYQFDVDFGMIQSIILGNLIYPYSRQNLRKGTDGYVYQQKTKEILISNFIGLETQKLERFDARDLRNDNSISVNYSNFKQVGEELIPYDIRADFEYKTGTIPKTSIEIGYSKAEFEDQSLNFPFSIPTKYTSY